MRGSVWHWLRWRGRERRRRAEDALAAAPGSALPGEYGRDLGLVGTAGNWGLGRQLGTGVWGGQLGTGVWGDSAWQPLLLKQPQML